MVPTLLPVAGKTHALPKTSMGGGEGEGGGGEGGGIGGGLGLGGGGLGGGGDGDGQGRLDHTLTWLYAQPAPAQLRSHSVKPRSWHRRTASSYVVDSKAEPQYPAMQPASSSVSTYRRHVAPSQHCAAIGSLSIGSLVCAGSVTHRPERSPA